MRGMVVYKLQQRAMLVILSEVAEAFPNAILEHDMTGTTKIGNLRKFVKPRILFGEKNLFYHSPIDSESALTLLIGS